MRRRIVMMLMIVRSAGLATVVVSLILCFVGTGADGGRLTRLGWLVAGVTMLWLLASSRLVDRFLQRGISGALDRLTDLDTRRADTAGEEDHHRAVERQQERAARERTAAAMGPCTMGLWEPP